MKKFKKITTLFMAFILTLSLFSCGQEATEEPSTSSSSSESSVDDGGEETKFYDDRGEYDAIIDKAEYAWSDSEGVLDGAFADGAVEKGYAAFSSVLLSSGAVKASQAELSVISGAELFADNTLNSSIREKVKGSHDDDKVMDGLENRNFLKVKNEGYKTVQLHIKPECTEAEFIEAEFISFKICFYRENTAKEETLYFKDRRLLRIFANTWYDIKIPLAFWRELGCADQGDLYEMLGDDNKYSFSIIGTATDGNAANDFVAYISDMTLGVEKIDETLGRNLLSLKSMAKYNEQNCPSNTFVFYHSTEKVSQMDEAGKNTQVIKYSTESNDGLNVAVIPAKKLEQIQKYDYLCVNLYVETENPFPILLGVNEEFKVSKKGTNGPIVDGVANNDVLVSANKWITYKIPIKGVLDQLYPRLLLNRVYTVANVPYVYYQSAMPLFFVNGDFVRSVNSEAKTETYGLSVYVSRIFLTKE